MKKTLYPWQEECLERWFANHGRGMVQAATGSGKTLLALTAAERLEERLGTDLHIKIIVPTGSLMLQWNRALQDFLADSSQNAKVSSDIRQKIGMRGAGRKAPADRKYMIYVINSARYELARQILSELQGGTDVLLIADECHHYASGQNSLVFEFLPFIKSCEARFFSLGMSATLPSGQAQSYLSSVLGKKIYSYEVNKASTLHTVCTYDVYHIELSFRPSEHTEYQEITERMKRLYHSLLQTHPFLNDLVLKERYEMLRVLTTSKNRSIGEAASLYLKLSYKRKNLVCLASSRISCAFDLVERLPQNEQILIFGERIRQADELYQLMQKRYPGRVGRYHSKMGLLANQNTLNRFRDGTLRILITCKAMDEGVDVPNASIGIILSGTSVQRQRIQRLGRIIRKKDGKSSAALYYLHIAESAEDNCFLPNNGERHLFELKYHSDTCEFLNPRYDKAAAKILRQMQKDGADARILAEAQRCLRLGIVRSDWLSEYGEIENHLKSSNYISDKNYWICMKKIAEILTT